MICKIFNFNLKSLFIQMIKNKLYTFSLETNKICEINSESSNLMNELIFYKNIVMNPNKNPDTYLKYITFSNL